MKTININTILKAVGLTLILTCCLLALANETKAQTTTETQPKAVKTCKGTTKAGAPCKSTFVVKGTDYCNAHQVNAIHCAGKNAKKEPCGMTVKQQGDFCRFHQPKTN